jgi:hypothetical protein
VLAPSSLDVIGIRISDPTRYFRPNTALLEKKKLGDWLSTIMSPVIQSFRSPLTQENFSLILRG